MHRLFVPALLTILALLSGCASDGMKTVRLKGETFKVELALDHTTRERGLMFRDSMPGDHGMLFVFPTSGPQAFWMKNTRIPLDIMYFDSDRGFVSASYRTPTCSGGNNCPSYASEGRARYVLELNGGVGAALNLVPGDKIELPDDLPAPR
jgi:uncharacterized protein